MTDAELLKVVEAVFVDAVADAEFSRLAKDLAYVEVVGNKLEGLRAKIAGREPIIVHYQFVNGRVFVTAELGTGLVRMR